MYFLRESEALFCKNEIHNQQFSHFDLFLVTVVGSPAKTVYCPFPGKMANKPRPCHLYVSSLSPFKIVFVYSYAHSSNRNMRSGNCLFAIPHLVWRISILTTQNSPLRVQICKLALENKKYPHLPEWMDDLRGNDCENMIANVC